MNNTKSKIIIGNEEEKANLQRAVANFSSLHPEVSIKDEFAIFPGFCDVHVHFREPGFSYKETIKSGSLSAAHGGYTAVCTMPNLNPVPDSKDNLRIEKCIIEKDAIIDVYPYGTITKGERGETLSDMSDIYKDVIAFSDDGKGVQNDKLLEEAMLTAKKLNKIVACHCEDNSLLNGGYIHEGFYAKEHGHKGISSASEYVQIERDLDLAKKTGAKYHVCHISTKESVELIRRAKKEGTNVTCETAPHYLVLDETDIEENGNFKMNPPLRSKEDKLALIEGIIDGTIDMIATDHAPHSEREKDKGLSGSLFGIVGLETAFPVLYTDLVKKGIITLERLIDLMSINPRKRFNIKPNGFSVWDLEKEYKINTNDFLSMGRSTPFKGKKVYGENQLTVFNNKTVYIK